MRSAPLTETKKDRKIISVSIMIMYAFWRFLLSETTFSISWLVYAGFLLVTVSLCSTLLKIGKIRVSLSTLVCFPYIMYVIFQYGFDFNFEATSYWLDCLLLILIAANTVFPNTIHEKLLIISGVIVVIGIFVQMLFPDFHYSNIASLFTNYSQIRYWGSQMGYAGFTYQLGQSASVLIVAEGAMLYFGRKKMKPFLFFLMTALFVVSIFLTGKRMLSMLSIMAPLIVYYFSGKSVGKRARRLALLIVIIILGLFALISNIDYLASTNIGIFSRLSSTLEMLNRGESIDASRETLIQTALDAFKRHPVFGIGAGKFMSATGAETDVHNAYIQTLCESGIIGFTFFVVMLSYYVLKTISLIQRSDSNIGCLQFSLFIQLVFIFNSFTENGNINLSEYFLYFVAVGLCIYADMEANRVRHQRIKNAVTE